MNVVAWLEELLQAVLAGSKIPQWVIDMVIAMMSRFITPDVVAAVEKQVVCFICAKISLVIGPNPDPVQAQLQAALNQLLGCDQCAAQGAPPAPPAP